MNIGKVITKCRHVTLKPLMRSLQLYQPNKALNKSLTTFVAKDSVSRGNISKVLAIYKNYGYRAEAQVRVESIPNGEIADINNVKGPLAFSDDLSTRIIIDPKINVSLPLSDLPILRDIVKQRELPGVEYSEVVDPAGPIVEKKAHRMIRIRRKKMKKHQKKKLMKRTRIHRAKIKGIKWARKEAVFKGLIDSIVKEADTYSPEAELHNKLSILRWTPPVTKARGMRAPPWVIDEFLEQKRRKELLDERVKECVERKK